MDLASLITNHGPDPLTTFKPRAMHTPPAFPTSAYKPATESAAGSYFTACVPTSYMRSPQPPLSPPVEDQPKCSLPSISSLLEGADSASVHAAKRQRTEPPAPREVESPRSSLGYEPVMVYSSHVRLPPTPPLRPGSGFHSNGHSPSTSISQCEIYQQQTAAHVTLPSPSDRSSISSQGSSSHLSGPPYASPAPSVASFSSPVEPPASSAAYYQRAPVSTNSVSTSAAPASSSHAQVITPVTPAWQHHHYFPPSTTAPYQQNHDRYICRTCHKAFSRPSSLRIHSHSHTGEKPFRCTHAGCGKAFSVRSNMKRHERGCHTGRAVAAAMV